MEDELKKLRAENYNMKEQLKTFIPRRRVRRVYKILSRILDEDTDVTPHIETLKDFINKIEKEGKTEAGQEIKTAIEHLLSVKDRW